MSTKYQTNKKVLVYCRESRDDFGVHYERIETQRDILLEFCKKQGLNNIVKVIIDDNITGTSFKRLDEIKDMMENGEVDIFVCKDASRLGRNLLESLKFIEFIEEHEVEILFESEEFNPELFPLIAWFNERRAKDDSDKIRRVLRHKLENGLVIVPPFGYKKENNTMVPDENSADIVRKIFEMAYNGSTPAQIANYLNVIHAPSPSEGHSTQRKIVNSIWSRDNVRRILKNRTYTGTYIGGKIEKVSYKSKKYRPVPEEKQIVIQNHHEALVSQENFDYIQAHLKSFKIASRRPTLNPLAGMMYCGRCGTSILLRARDGDKPVKYVCGKHNREGVIKDELRPNWGCGSHAVYYEDIKNIILDYVSQFMKNEKFKGEILKDMDFDKELSKTKDTIANLHSKAKKLQTKFDVLYEDKLNGLLPDFMFIEKSQPVTEEIKQIKEQINLFESELKRNTVVNPADQYEKCVKKLYETGLTHEAVSRLFSKIIVYEPHDITEADREEYHIKDEQYNELYEGGGLLFVQERPWSNIAISTL